MVSQPPIEWPRIWILPTPGVWLMSCINAWSASRDDIAFSRSGI